MWDYNTGMCNKVSRCGSRKRSGRRVKSSVDEGRDGSFSLLRGRSVGSRPKLAWAGPVGLLTHMLHPG